MIRLCLIAALVSTSLGAADPLAEVFARMDKAAASFKGMTADLTQVDYTKLVDDKTISTGGMKLRRNKGDIRFLVNFTNPDNPRSVSFAGTEVRIYKPIAKLENIVDVTAQKGAIEQAMMLGFGATSDEIKKSYDVSYVGPDTIEGQRTSQIKLIPKSKDVKAKLEEANLWISDTQGVPLQQKFISPGGNYNQFTYSNLKLTSSLSDKDLQLQVPRGVEIKRLGAAK